MSKSVQVIYPVGDGTTFDFDYYLGNHMAIVTEAAGRFVDRSLVTKGLSGGPDTPPGFHAIASFTFADQAAVDGFFANIGPALEDIPNFTNVQPQLLIGDVVA